MTGKLFEFRRLQVLLFKEYLVNKKNLWATLLVAVIIPAAVSYTLLVVIPTDGERIVKINRPNGGEFSAAFKTMTPDMLTANRPLIFCRGMFDNYSVYFYPNDSSTQTLMKSVQSKCNRVIPVGKDNLTAMETELNDAIKIQQYRRPMAGIVFHNISITSKKLHYDIIPTNFAAKNVLFKPEKMSPVSLISLYNIFPPYMISAFVAIQMFLNEVFIEAVIAQQSNNTYSFSHTVNSVFQYATIDTHEDMVFLIPMIVFHSLFISMLLPIFTFLKRVLDEKSSEMKQFLKQMSMGEFEYWLSKFIALSALFLALTSYTVILLSYQVKGRIQLSVMFTFIFLYFISSLLMAMFVSVFFNRTIVGLSTFLAIQLASTTPFWRSVKKPGLEDFTVFQGETSFPEFIHFLLCVTATPNYSLVLLLFLVLEGSFYAKASSYDPSAAYFIPNWSNIFNVPPHYSLLSPGLIIIAMIMSCFLWLLALWFFSRQETVKHLRSFTQGFSNYTSEIVDKIFTEKNGEDKTKKSAKKSTDYFEAEPNLKPGIVISNLVKKFGDKRPSVKNLSLKLYYGEITVLLGHNGAGKSTLMNMVTGMFPPTSGTIKINEFDIVQETDKAKRNVGLCPQKAILYPDFSVEEHLYIFGILKGFPKDKMYDEMDRVLDLVNLDEKRSVNVSELSGGMQRKLQIGIAIVGGCDILILDEPSSGLDVDSRRLIWDFLMSIRKNFLIFMTTHHMEEADCLSDRIIIMSEGQVVCSGSTQFLKRVFNVGYHLRILTSNSEKSLIHKFVKSRLKDVKLESETANELIYRFPQDKNVKLPNFFREIDANLKNFKIESYGVNVTSLDDVFIESFTVFKEHGKEWTSDPKRFTFEKTERTEQFSLILPLMVKRLRIEKKRLRIFFAFILLSFIATYVSFEILKSGSQRVPYYTEEFNKELNFTSLGYNSTIAFCYGIEVFCQNYAKTAKKFNVTSDTITSDPWIHSKHLSNDHKHYNTYLKTVLSGASISYKDNTYHYVVWYSEHAPHSLPISTNILYNAVLQWITNDTNAQIRTGNHAFPNELYTRTFDKVYQYGIDVYTMPWIMLLAFVLAAPFSSSFATNENVSKTKLLQFMSGVSPVMYWCANFFFDFIYLVIVFLPFWVVTGIFYNRQVFYLDTGNAILVGFLGFVFSTISTNYLLSFFFSPSTVYYVVVIFSAIPVTVINVVILLISMFENTPDFSVIAKTTLNILRIFCRISPFWLFTEIILRVTRLTNSVYVCKSLPINILNLFCLFNAPFFDICCRYKCGTPCFESDYKPFVHPVDGVSYEIKLLYGLFAAQTVAILFLEWDLLKKRVSREMPALLKQDSEVLNERKKVNVMVEERKTECEALVSHNLSKVFTNFATFKEFQNVLRNPKSILRNLVAVNQLSFGLHKNEVFGFLGVNGAGKTTTFQLLAGDLFPSYGNAFVGSLTLKKDIKKYQKHIGYCPQTDSLIDYLTGKETLEFFAKIRGVKGEQLASTVKQIIHLMDLDDFADIQCNVYSGGNKRKLALGMAIIGSPDVMLLDEPTTGVDPVARRRMWKAIEQYKKSTKTGALMLTTHSMDECEALCNRIAILYNGQLQCIGSIQRLKTRFCKGFTVYIKMRRDASNFQKIDNYMQQKFQNVYCTSNRQPVVIYQIRSTQITISQIYEVMEEAKKIFNLEESDVNQTSLEQIFLSFVDNP